MKLLFTYLLWYLVVAVVCNFFRYQTVCLDRFDVGVILGVLGYHWTRHKELSDEID